jgi:hypothetical protein
MMVRRHPCGPARHDHRAGEDFLFRRRIDPAVPEPGEGEDRRTVGDREQMRLLAVRLVRSLEKPARRNDAAPALEASRNIGFSATASARASKVAGAVRLLFQRYCTRPQCKRPARAAPRDPVGSRRHSSPARCYSMGANKLSTWFRQNTAIPSSSSVSVSRTKICLHWIIVLPATILEGRVADQRARRSGQHERYCVSRAIRRRVVVRAQFGHVCSPGNRTDDALLSTETDNRNLYSVGRIVIPPA